ncbi:hypothetical protein [Mesorhizobium sp. M6A.T.Ce.TU.016.01.1.1]|uniref:hypothetical protein n=1 Tax=Mesorhizobium sp. M6A.T.Ce.TU.016.01.1.1 TaxID=2496783 RepID=UPI000FCC4A13|nr:hypothetical protein [Mesorhizobium sp. M6A.T.Ce.TU.016.01.1.1]RUU29510.1 hypothetical protein EOC94_11525 [Mesorhizobium sp. M6A.T.Ce.TU.016.01.1.1]
MNKIKVRLQEHRHFFIHNDLANAAYYFKERIAERLKNDDREGVALEMMACLTMIAFAVEAKINFLGHKLISKWDERAPYLTKVKMVTKQLGVAFDEQTRPYKTVRDLKNFRDTMAHGKPIELQNDKEIITTHEELERRGYLTADWQSQLNEQFVNDAFDDMEVIWRDLLSRSKLEIFDTLTGGGSTITFIEHVE